MPLETGLLLSVDDDGSPATHGFAVTGGALSGSPKLPGSVAEAAKVTLEGTSDGKYDAVERSYGDFGK